MECEVFTRTEARNIFNRRIYRLFSIFSHNPMLVYVELHLWTWADTPGSSFTIHCTHLWVASHQTVPGCGSAWTSWSWAQRGARGFYQSRGDHNSTCRTLVLQAQNPGGWRISWWLQIPAELLPNLWRLHVRIWNPHTKHHVWPGGHFGQLRKLKTHTPSLLDAGEYIDLTEPHHSVVKLCWNGCILIKS